MTSNDPINELIERSKPLLSKLTVGGILGYCSGTAAKKVGKALAIIVGLVYMGVQSAAYGGYLQIDWKKVETDITTRIDTDGDGKFTEQDLKNYWNKVKEILKYNIPNASGFSVGFLYGLKY